LTLRCLLGLVGCGVLATLMLRRRFTVVTVTGDSMLPTFGPGDRVLVRRVRIGRLRRGQVVVVEMPGTSEWMIKRVAALPGDPRPADCLPATEEPVERCVPRGKLVVLGDNPPWSQDSRQIGYVPGDRLLGVVVRPIGGSLHAAFPAGPAAPRMASWALPRTSPHGSAESRSRAHRPRSSSEPARR
jgi:signal peptidase I